MRSRNIFSRLAKVFKDGLLEKIYLRKMTN
jgi:hypothetical protein